MRGREPSGHEPRAIQRGLQLLEAVAEIGPGVTAAQLAAHTDIPRATTYKLLNILVAEGFLVRIADLSGFALGVRTQQLADAQQPVGAPDNVTVLGELRDAVRYGVFLTAYSGGRIRLVDRDPDHELPGVSTMLRNPHACAAGKVLLAQHEPAPDASYARLTPHTITDPQTLHAQLVDIRDRGVAVEVDESRVGRSAIAMPVHDGDHAVTGALTVVGRTGHFPTFDAGFIDLVRHHADSLRLALRGTRQ